MSSYTLNPTTTLGLPITEVKYEMRDSELTVSPPYDTIVLHHTGNSGDYTLERLIKKHTGKKTEGGNEWGAIGYHFVIDREGTIYNTRPLMYKGSHAFPNTGKVGIAFNYSLDLGELTDASAEAAKKLIKALQHYKNIPQQNIVGHVQVDLNNLNKMFEDRDITPTHTPDDVLNVSSTDEFEEVRQTLAEYVSGHKEEAWLRKRILGMPGKTPGLKTCPGVNAYPFLQDLRTCND